MKLSTQLPYGDDPIRQAEAVVTYEQAGLDVVWVAEAYSFDAVSVMGYLAARTERVEIGAGILPIYSRTPTLTAMSAAGVDALSGGRAILGLGASGPQVIEGFHGVRLRQAGGPHPGDHRDLQAGVAPRAGGARRASTRSRSPRAGHRARQGRSS